MEENKEKEYEEIFDENGAMKVEQTTFTGPSTKAKRLTLLICFIAVIVIIGVSLYFV